MDFVEVTGKVDFDGGICLLLHLFFVLASPRVHCLARGFGDDLIFHGKGKRESFQNGLFLKHLLDYLPLHEVFQDHGTHPRVTRLMETHTL